MKITLRKRITIWSTLAAGMAVLACGSVAIFFVRREMLKEMDAELGRKAEHFFSELQLHGGKWFDWRRVDHEIQEWLPVHDPLLFIETRVGDRVRWSSKNLIDGTFAQTPNLPLRDERIGDRNLRVLTRTNEGVTLSLGQDYEEVTNVLETMAWGLLAGLPVAMAFAWIGGRRLAALALRPISQMTRATAAITADQLDKRVPVPPAADEIRRHAEVLNNTLDRLERSYHQSLRFSADASHELKTPLTVMRSTIEEALEAADCPESIRPVLTTLLEQTRRLTDITSSLLLLAKADAGVLTLETSEYDLASLTEACVDDAAIQAEKSAIQVTCELPSEAPAKVDVLRFHQILSNLLDNAVKYNHPCGRVAVQLADESPYWRLTVANTGRDIPVADIPYLFRRFFRAGQGSGTVPGHGLGLSLARELATAHGGDLRLVRSEHGWTEFSLMMPRQAG